MILEELVTNTERMVDVEPYGFVMDTSAQRIALPMADTITDDTFSAMVAFTGFKTDDDNNYDVDFKAIVDFKYSLEGAKEFNKLSIRKVHPVEDDRDEKIIKAFNRNLHAFMKFNTEPVQDDLENDDVFMDFLSGEHFKLKDE